MADRTVPSPPDMPTAADATPERRSFGGRRTRPASRTAAWDPNRNDRCPGTGPDSPSLLEESDDGDASATRRVKLLPKAHRPYRRYGP